MSEVAAEQGAAPAAAERLPMGPERKGWNGAAASAASRVQSAAGNRAVAWLMRGSTDVDGRLSTVRSELDRPGEPLDGDVRVDAEARLGRKLPDVHVHRGSRAPAAVNATAFAVGTHVVLGEDVPPASSAEGRRVLVHELAHVLQQPERRSLALVPPGAPAERQAAAAAAGAGGPVGASAAGGLARLVNKDVTRLNDDELRAEYDLMIHEIAEHPSGSDHDADVTYMQEIEQEVTRRSGSSSTATSSSSADSSSTTTAATTTAATDAGGARTDAAGTVPRPPGLPLDQGFTLQPIELPPEVLARLPEGQPMTLGGTGVGAGAAATDRSHGLHLPQALGPGGAMGLTGMNAALATRGFAAAGDNSIGLIAIPRTQMNPFTQHFNAWDPAAPFDTWGHTAMIVRQNGRITAVRGFNPDLVDAVRNYQAVEQGTHASPAELTADSYLFRSTAARTIEWPVEPALAARVAANMPPTGQAGAAGAPPFYTARPATMTAANPGQGAQCSNCGLWAVEQVEDALGGPVGRAGGPPITSVTGRGTPPIPRTASQGQLIGMLDEAAQTTGAGAPSTLSPMPNAIGEPVAATMSGGARVMKYMGRGFLVVGVAATGYEIYAAPPEQRTRTAVGGVSGFVGGLAFGAAAGLVCGPGAPVCSFVLGVGFGVAGSIATRRVAEEIYDESHPQSWPVTDPTEQAAMLSAANRGTVCPNCHAAMTPPPRSLGPAQLPPPFERTLTPADMQLIRRFLSEAQSSSGGQH